MLAGVYRLEMSVMIKSSTALPLVGACTICFSFLLRSDVMSALLKSPQMITPQWGCLILTDATVCEMWSMRSRSLAALGGLYTAPITSR